MDRTHFADRGGQLSLLSAACSAHEAARVRLRAAQGIEQHRWHDANLLELVGDGVLLRWGPSASSIPVDWHRQLLEVRFGFRGAQYGFVSTAETTGAPGAPAADSGVIRLAMPAGLQRHDRRRNARVTLTRSDNVTARLSTIDEPVTRVHGWLMDLSRGGLAMRILGKLRPPPAGTVVRAEIDLPGQTEELSLLMIIKRVTPLGVEGEYSVACMVVPADDQFQYQTQFDRIDCFVESYRECMLAAVVGGASVNSCGG